MSCFFVCYSLHCGGTVEALWRQCPTKDGKARQRSKNTRRTKHKEKAEMLDRVQRPTGTEREGNRLNAPGREVDEGQVK